MSETDRPRLADLWDRAVHGLTGAASEPFSLLLQDLTLVKLPLVDKYREVDVLSVLRDNATIQGFNAIGTAFNILEKYGRNLLSPNKPKFWRAVKFNNPVFKSTVDAIKGGRDILRLYGYTVEQQDGMSFPEDVNDPDLRKVAAVTAEVALLQVELDLLRKDTHPHPELFSQFLTPGSQEVTSSPHLQDRRMIGGDPGSPTPNTRFVPIGIPPTGTTLRSGGMSPGEGGKAPLPEGASSRNSLPVPGDAGATCAVCSAESVVSWCRDCSLFFCRDCDGLYHRHPARAEHQRSPVLEQAERPRESRSGPWASRQGDPSSEPAGHRLGVGGSRPGLGRRSLSAEQQGPRAAVPKPERRASELGRMPWTCAGCCLANESRAVLCVGCERPRASRAPAPILAPTPVLAPGPARDPWCCQACTCQNEASAVLCLACDRPRLAGKPTFGQRPDAPSAPAPSSSRDPPQEDLVSGWECRHCTYINARAGRICEMCDRTTGEGDSSSPSCSQMPSRTPPMFEEEGAAAEAKRQWEMREAGLRLVTAIRWAEMHQVSPEEVVCALRCSGETPPLPWLETELPRVLETISELAVRQGEAAGRLVGPVGREEAHQAWLACGGCMAEAVRWCVLERSHKVRAIMAMGFSDEAEVLQALYMNSGDVDKAVIDLQRQLLEPFHVRIWEELEVPIRIDQPDKERVLRQILATYSLPSWGRAEIVLSLMLEGSEHYQIHDVVEAVKESHDRQFIKRTLSLSCLICLSLFPRKKMQSLTSCECTICQECFKDYFTFMVRERHIKDLVCPGCLKPDIDDEGQRLSYFSTLDVQLRDCLDTDVYNLFHKKLTERTLMTDPKFKWCTHCSNGFIYDGNQIRVTCPQCQGSFCVECKRPWEQQHQGISCEDFQNWKRENDPEYQAQGLAAYLKENGIDCPKCNFRYALARGGCMHFTCTQCQHQFCSGCYNTFLGKKKCNDPSCRLKDSLHAHHPRDCLSYLRDWPVNMLQALLQKHGVNFDTEPPVGAEATPGGRCRVMQQREDQGKMTDEACGNESCQGHAGLCESHYKEYLVSRINGHSLDPAQLFTELEMERFLSRSGKNQAPRGPNEDEAQYRSRLLKVISSVPLGDKVPRIRK